MKLLRDSSICQLLLPWERDHTQIHHGHACLGADHASEQAGATSSRWGEQHRM